MDFETRTIFLGDIDPRSSSGFIKAMHLLQSDSDLPIHIILNSNGGHWTDALAIYDCIVSADTMVTVEVYGKCMSAAVPIVQACDERGVHPNATVMIHNGSQDSSGDVLSFEAWGKWAKRERERMYDILASKSGRPSSFWRRKCQGGDFICGADQAVELGLFDGVIRRS